MKCSVNVCNINGYVYSRNSVLLTWAQGALSRLEVPCTYSV